MQIQQLTQNVVGTINQIPTQLLSNLSVGQQVEATVAKAALAAQIATIRVDNVLLDIKTPVPLQQGQTVQPELSQSANKTILKLVQVSPPQAATSVASISPDPAQFVVGQRINVDVIALLAKNRLLVEARLPQPELSRPVQPLRVDVDVSRLSKSFSVGERAVIEVANLKPLALVIKPAESKETVLVDRIKQLLPQLATQPNLNNISTALNKLTLPDAVRNTLTQLLSTVIAKETLTQPGVLKQALQLSGSFTERQLTQRPPLVQQDFKANLLKAAGALETVLANKPLQSQPSPQNTGGQVSQANALSSGSLGRSQSSPSQFQPQASPLNTSGQVNQANALSPASLGRSQLSPSQSPPQASPLNTGDQVNQANALSTASLGRSQLSATQSQPVSQPSQPTQTTSSTANATVTVDKVDKVIVNNQPTNATKANQAIQASSNGPVNSNPVPPNVVGAAPQTEAANTAGTPSSRPTSLLAAILQALGAYQPTASAVAVLHNAPSTVSLPVALPAYLETMLTQQQATNLAQALSRTISVEQQLRVSGQFDVLVLQGLLREVESLHARVQLNQLSMLKDPDTMLSPTASWLIDLPVKDKQQVDFIQLQLDQFKQFDQDEETSTWQVQLRLDTQNLGPVQATVMMQYQEVEVVIRAERPESAALLEANLVSLNKALSRLDVSVRDLSCQCGEVAKPTLSQQYLSETTSLVDVSV